MPIFLTILDLIVVAVVVYSVSRAVWTGRSGDSASTLLAVCVTAALLVFGVVSLSAADGLTSNSGFNQGALLIFLVAVALVSRLFPSQKENPIVK
jgi:hypothetical protein